MRLFQYISIALLVTCIGWVVYHSAPGYQIISGEMFATTYKIKIRTDHKNKELKHKVREKLEEINASMSVFEPESEVSRINALSRGKQIELSGDMQKVLKAAGQGYKASGGWFDPTLAPVIELWGFGPKKMSKTPSDAEVKKALRSVGFSKLNFLKNGSVLKKAGDGVWLDLSAIAKGFAVDEIAALLDREGLENYLVEIGGEVKTRGFRSPKGDPWIIGVNRPEPKSSENMIFLSLSNLAVATSGNYRNFYQTEDGVVAHTISYKTGKPVLSDALSVSVFHESCMYADMYATAMTAMGADAAITFADKLGLKAFVIDSHFKLRVSKAAEGLL